MADFSSLKQTIQSYIKQNGNEEITGNILQDILLAMVSTMGDSAINGLASALQDESNTRRNQDGILQGNITELGGRIDGLQTAINGINTKLAEGCIYAGIATPSTNPGTHVGKVFYVAVQAGTYTNFNGISVIEGITILKNNGTTWTKELIHGIDNIPTYHSNNLVKSGGVADGCANGSFELGSIDSIVAPGIYLRDRDQSSVVRMVLFVSARSSNITQTLVSYSYFGYSEERKRSSSDGGTTWSEWEYEEKRYAKLVSRASQTKRSSGYENYSVNLTGNTLYLFSVSCTDTGKIFLLNSGSVDRILLYDIFGNVLSSGEGAIPFTEGQYLMYCEKDATLLRITDNTNANFSVDIYEADFLMKNIFDIAKNFHIKPIDQKFPEILCDYTRPLSNDVLKKYINGEYTVSQFSEILNFADDGGLNHDATLVIYNGYAYAVYTYNSNGSDSAVSPNAQVRLKKVNMSDPTDSEMYIVAKNGDERGSYIQTGGAGSPTMCNVNGILHIIYAANVDNAFIEMHTTFNISSGTFGTYEKLTLTDGINSGVINNTLLGSMFGNAKADSTFNQLQANCTIGVNDGVYYAGLVYGDGDGNALIIKSTNFINWTLVTTMDFDCKSAYELAVWCKGGYLYATKRLPYPKSDMGTNVGSVNGNNTTLSPLAKWDITNKRWISAVAVKNCCTRPTFFEYNNGLYLLTCGTDRENGQIILINENKLDNSKIIEEINDRVCTYASIANVSNVLYIIGTRDGGGNSIPLFEMILNHFSDSAISQKFLNIMNND